MTEVQPTLAPAPAKRKRGRPRVAEELKVANQPNRSHVANTGKRIDPRRIDRAEELFCGLGPGGRPLGTRAILKCLTEEFGVSEAQAKVYLRCVRDRLKERNACFDPEAETERLTCMFLECFGTAKDEKDANAMVSATYRLAEMRGLYQRQQKTQVEIKGIGELFAQVFEQVPQTFESTAEVIHEQSDFAENGSSSPRALP